MNTLLQDVRHGVQAFVRAPGFTAAAGLPLALGIGANTTIFSWINSTLLNPIPGLSRTSDVVSITRGDSAENPTPLSYPDYVDLRNRNRSFSDMIGFNINQMGLTTRGKPQRIWGALVSANYFDALGVNAVLGRGFLPAEDQTPWVHSVNVISYRLWQSHFAGDSSVIGRTISINRHPYSIVGVAPPVFQGTQTGLRVELWVPVSMQAQASAGVDRLHDRDESWLMLLGRLKSGVSSQQAQQELNVLMRQIAAQYPESHKSGNEIPVYPLCRAPYGANVYLYVLLPILMAIAGLVLLLACANVANLLLVR